jgi:CubicO group peptidase (beta-lactamase class C family)
MTYSVTKSFLSSVVGLAYDGGLIRSVDDIARDYMAPIQLYTPFPMSNRADRLGAPDLIDLFDTPHNRAITWNHLLRQTSDREGALLGKPDWADRPSEKPNEWLTRPRNKAGAVYKHNDTRVNVLALAALNVWRRPLPQVLKERIMDRIGASNTWRWFGYDNAWIVIDGQPAQSVTGGGHWGGGMFINAYDMARFGYLTLRRGKWGDRQLLSEKWMNMALTPTGGCNRPTGSSTISSILTANSGQVRRAPPLCTTATGSTWSTSIPRTTLSRLYAGSTTTPSTAFSNG